MLCNETRLIITKNRKIYC